MLVDSSGYQRPGQGASAALGRGLTEHLGAEDAALELGLQELCGSAQRVGHLVGLGLQRVVAAAVSSFDAVTIPYDSSGLSTRRLVQWLKELVLACGGRTRLLGRDKGCAVLGVRAGVSCLSG